MTCVCNTYFNGNIFTNITCTGPFFLLSSYFISKEKIVHSLLPLNPSHGVYYQVNNNFVSCATLNYC